MRFPFGRKEPRPAEAAAEVVHDGIIAAVRQPAFYLAFGVPDTFMGRFELLVLFSTPVLRRLRAGTDAEQQIAQELVDSLFRRLDVSLRELGVGDVTVPKRMKKLAQAFRGRSAAYDEALDTGREAALAAAIGRNVLDGQGSGHDLAGFVLEADRQVAAVLFDPLRPDRLVEPLQHLTPDPPR